MMHFLTELVTNSEEIAKTDPSGLFIALVSISFVFATLIVLFFAYSLIGQIVKRTENRHRKATEEPKDHDAVAAAIAMALNEYMKDGIHDIESYRITIKRK